MTVQLDLFPTDLHLRQQVASTRCSFSAPVFDAWAESVRGGRLRHDLYPSAGNALDALRELARRKLQRGYETV
ncbi:hypothetical protein L1787_17965 [Acuticoccus sp. M5D2P5]|uniref:hypothetical protein n=1 Tax=Acuticoccus kalidii TaxID=2910977 RepID=UPI001F232253|nr:hypothetical protein [Acuticoccus kalidii]MCF3935289.1 hypothetical protein [Acuticoccus kalidii]